MKRHRLLSASSAERLSVRIRPGGLIAIPRPILLALGGDTSKISVEVKADRLVLQRRKSAAEARLERFKAKLAERMCQAALAERHRTLAKLAAQAQELDMG